MRPGGGAAKGADFERVICGKLSLWVSAGARSDLFTRNDMSGGSFTVRTKKKEDTLTPGDIMAAHPMGNPFLARYQVECKAYASLGVESFFFQPLEKSFIGQVIAKAQKECRDAGGLDYLLIAKQNQRDIWLFCSGATGAALLHSAGRWAVRLRYHMLHQEKVFACPLEDVTSWASCKRLLSYHIDQKEP